MPLVFAHTHFGFFPSYTSSQVPVLLFSFQCASGHVNRINYSLFSVLQTVYVILLVYLIEESFTLHWHVVGDTQNIVSVITFCMQTLSKVKLLLIIVMYFAFYQICPMARFLFIINPSPIPLFHNYFPFRRSHLYAMSLCLYDLQIAVTLMPYVHVQVTTFHLQTNSFFNHEFTLFEFDLCALQLTFGYNTLEGHFKQ